MRYIRPSEHGSSAAVIVDDVPLAQTTQLFPINEGGDLIGGNDPEKQFAQVLRNVAQCLKAAGTDLNKVAKLNIYVSSDEIVPVVQKALARQFAGAEKPAASFVVTSLPIPDAQVAADAVAAIAAPMDDNANRDQTTTHMVVARDKSKHAPRVTYCPKGARIYISGQAEKAATLAEATRLTLLSLDASLKFCGRTKADVVQVKCFLTPMKQVSDVDAELEKFFAPLAVPAVSHVEWQSTLPIEIEVVAHGGRPDAKTGKKIEYLTPPGMTASPVYSRIARAYNPTTIFIGGLYGESGSNGAAQVERIFGELDSLLKETDSDFQHLAKATYYVSQDEPSQKLNELRPKYYKPDSPPAASKAQVRGVGKAGVGLTLDMIAVTPK